MILSDQSPIFLISLPRSGSTLLQKVLATSAEIATANEPWVALPLAYMRRDRGLASEYWQKTCAMAINDVVAQFPNGEEDFHKLCRVFLAQTYANLSSGNERYFLDKTPRYYLISDFLEDVFPDAHFIYLFRNPLDAMTSIFKTWHNNRFSPNLRGSAVDIWHGPEHIALAYQHARAKKLRIDYETFVCDPETVLQQLEQFLDLEFPKGALENFVSIKLPGRMGDPSKGHKYQGIKNSSVGTWPGFVTNAYRKQFLKTYIKGLPETVLQTFHLDRDQLLAELDAIKPGFNGTLWDMAGHNWYRLAVWLQKLHPHPGSRIFPPQDIPKPPLG